MTVTQQPGRLPTFPELQELARQHGVHIIGNEPAGDFCYPDPEQPKVKGNYWKCPFGPVLREHHWL